MLLQGRSPSFDPDAATISGEGVSPAAIAAASGSPPGNASASCATDAGRAFGSRSMQRRMRRSTTGSIPSRISDIALGVCVSFCSPQFGKCRCREGLLAGVDLVQHQSQRVHVAADGCSLAGQLLRRHVGRRAGDLGRLGFVFHCNGQTEIGDADAAVPVEHDVGRLEVAMQHSAFMRGRKSGCKLPRDVQSLFVRQMPDALEQRCEVFAVDVFHREEMPSIDLRYVVNAADIRDATAVA